MLVGLSPASTPDLGTTVAKDSPANVSIYVDRAMYRSILGDLSSAGILILNQRRPKIAGFSANIFFILVQPRHKTAGQ